MMRYILIALLFLLADLGPKASLAAQDKVPDLSSLTEAQWREDVRYFAAELTKRHKNAFHNISRQDFEKAVAELDAALPSLSPSGIVVGMLKITARIGDAHT